ncbi:MAG: DUF2059 domain-containing protein [Alphaproteobacteria bacterium]|nr:DUF2059 domain-containing protein [Alphaproteobacteria bacterium]
MSAFVRPAAARIAALLCALLFAAALSPSARAQELSPEHVALARQYVDLTYKISTFEQSLIQAGIDVSDAILRVDPSLEEKSNKAIGDAIGYFATQKDEVLNQFARVYALHFSMEEFKEMNAFYSSPTGQKLSGLQSQISNNVVNLFRLYEDNMRKEMYARVRADLIAQGADL